jgi:hypothetical protein
MLLALDCGKETARITVTVRAQAKWLDSLLLTSTPIQVTYRSVLQ